MAFRHAPQTSPSLHQAPDPARGRLLTVREWTKEHAWPPEGGLRHLIFNANENGANAWIRRVGRRVLIDEAAFFAWVDARNEGGQR